MFRVRENVKKSLIMAQPGGRWHGSPGCGVRERACCSHAPPVPSCGSDAHGDLLDADERKVHATFTFTYIHAGVHSTR